MKPARGGYAKVAVTMIVGCALGCGSEPEQTSSASAGNGGSDTTSSPAGGAGSGGTKASGGTTMGGAAGAGGGQGGSGASAATASGGSGTGGSSTSNGGSGGSGGSGAVQPAPTCTKSCQTSADCDPGEAYNYTCVAGACEFHGCTTDAGCVDIFGAGYVCQIDSGFATPICTKACQVKADCDQSPAYSYQCVSGACRFGGCAGDAGCVDAFGAGYVCLVDSGFGSPLCVNSCQTNADCSQGTAAFDADNYKCTGGACKFAGCNSDAECVASFSANYVCH